MMEGEDIVEARDVVKHFPVRYELGDRIRGKGRQHVHAVDTVSLSVKVKETLGLVGESGSGKTTLGKVMLMLDRPTSGQILFKGQDLTTVSNEELRAMRQKMQVVFQNPHASLDPRQRIRDIVGEPLTVFKKYRRSEIDERVARMVDAVGLPLDGMMRFPHEFSG
ncbi:MAG: ATP-binding cassette domain-containing protein, partial [Nitrososphaerales archaeon]